MVAEAPIQSTLRSCVPIKGVGDGTDDVVFLHTPGTGRVEMVSGSVVHVHGVAVTEVLADPRAWTARIVDEDRPGVLEAFGEMLAGRPFEVDYRVLRVDGTIGCVHDRLVAMGGEGPLVRVARDISRLQSLERQLVVAQRMESVALLARGGSHEYNNLLMGLVGCANLALKALDSDSRARPWLEEIKSSALQGASLARNLSVFASGGESGPEPVELSAALRQAVKLLRTLVGEEIVIRTELPDQPVHVALPLHHLEQVLLNLGMNARDAMAGGGVMTLRASTEAVGPDAAVSPGTYAVITVEDTGEGMSEEVQQRVFEPFFSASARGGGTGLGLTTADTIVRRGAGDITIESILGVGTRVKIRLPRVRRTKREDEELSIPPGRWTILVVEDDARVRRTMCGYLASAGCIVLSAGDEREALAKLRLHQRAIDLVVCDVMLPGVTGGAVAKTIGGRYPGLPVLFVSGHSQETLWSNGSVPVNAQVLQKPIEELRLTSEVARLLREKEGGTAGTAHA